jgi:major membrane immunogen (membrane-anchored lipoprotein)
MKIMKTIKNLISTSIILLSLYAFSYHKGEDLKTAKSAQDDTSSSFMDGNYEGYSRDGYPSEPYWGHIRITVENGSFTDVYFTIRDSSSHEPVDSMYGVIHFPDNPTYQDQCVNDGHGIEQYPLILMETQNLDKVDRITKATWSWKIFMACADSALHDAKIPSDIVYRSQNDRITVTAVPNPFATTLTLEYNLLKPSYVSLGIYNSQGKMIKKLVDQQQDTGHYTVRWNECPTVGIYFYRLQVDDKIFSSKLIRLKE